MLNTWVDLFPIFFQKKSWPLNFKQSARSEGSITNDLMCKNSFLMWKLSLPLHLSCLFLPITSSVLPSIPIYHLCTYPPSYRLALSICNSSTFIQCPPITGIHPSIFSYPSIYPASQPASMYGGLVPGSGDAKTK